MRHGSASQTLAEAATASSASQAAAGRRLLQASQTTPSTTTLGVVVPTSGAAAIESAIEAKLTSAVTSGQFARVLSGAGAVML
jgi:hypothetical protein